MNTKIELFIACRDIFVVACNQSPEIGIVQFDRISSSLIVLEPDEPPKLPIDEGIHTDNYTHADRQIDRHTGRQTNRQTD